MGVDYSAVGAFRVYTMNQQLHPVDPSFEVPMSAEQDLLASIFASGQPYPWEPLSPDGEDYLNHVEAQLDGDPEVEDAIAAGWYRVSSLLETQWASAEATAPERLLSALKARFQERMPEDALGTLAAAAAKLVQSGRPLAEQLVETAQAILPGWDTGDLVVMARPLAYSLRDGQNDVLDVTLGSVPQVEWESLSDIEKARLGLAIASVALNLAKQED
jgi:hypothetical protein